MSYPSELKYSPKHMWAKIEGNVATIGITFFAQEQLGDIVFVELPKVGATINKDTPCGVVESAKVASDLIAPLSGKVIEVNTELDDSPEIINEEPYEKGWMAKVEITDADGLLDAAGYQASIAE